MPIKSSSIAAEFVRISFQTLYDEFLNILLKQGFSSQKAKTCARVFAQNSLDGVYTHGVNRFAKFVQFIKGGYVQIDAEPKPINSMGCLEQWDGQLAPGITNAIQSTDRAMEVARQYGMGCVGLSNTNHWMRGGYYGWHAAKAGFVFIGWTNTLGNMPAWGAVDSRLGNNPLVIAIPFNEEAIVLDMAMAQYSYGTLDLYRLKKEKLPIAGGYSREGEITDDPGEIITSRRVLPIGYWKGSGLSLLLDILAATLSSGLATHEITKLPVEYGLSQVFIVIDITKLKNYEAVNQTIQHIINDYTLSKAESEKTVRYPGERIISTRKDNMANGIPVSKEVWDEIIKLRI